MNIAYNTDCLEAMREMKDKEFDLAVVDPPYGNGNDETEYNRFTPTGHFQRYGSQAKVERRGCGWATKYGNRIVSWDVAPPDEYFEQLFRVSKNQIIWGGNYFQLPPTRCFLIWRKPNIPSNFTMSMAEYAWTSYRQTCKVFDYPSQGQKHRWHPTQKPIELYKWIYSLFTEPGMRILDTHLGSGTSRMAAYDMGLDFAGYEIDKEYFEKQEKGFEEYTSQFRFF